MVKNPPANAGDAGSLGQDDPLEEEMATHSSILTRRIPWTEEPGRLQSMGLQRVGHNSASEPSIAQLKEHPLSVIHAGRVRERNMGEVGFLPSKETEVCSTRRAPTSLGRGLGGHRCC